MTAVTLEQIQAKQTELASMIAQLLATPNQLPTSIEIEEDSIELAAGEHYAGAVLDANGQPETASNAERILKLLANELR